MWSSTLTNHTFQSSTLVHIFEKIIVNEDKNIYNKILKQKDEKIIKSAKIFAQICDENGEIEFAFTILDMKSNFWGNVDEKKAKELIKKIILDNKISNVKFMTDYNVYVKNILNNVEVVRENIEFSTSSVCCNYKVRGMCCYRDRVLLTIVKNLLSSNNSDVLFNYLRNDNDLVYRTNAYTYGFGTLSLISFTGSKNIDMIFELYEKAMNYISDINYIESRLPLFTEKARIDNELDKEELSTILFDYVDKYLGYTNEKYYDVIKSIKPLEVKDFIDNRLVMVSKYIGVGKDYE
mgnify:CR=1 FL=1